MKQSNHIDIMLIIISKFVLVYTTALTPNCRTKFLSLDWNDESSSDCSMSVNAMFHKCLYNLRKNKHLLRLSMLVVVE